MNDLLVWDSILCTSGHGARLSIMHAHHRVKPNLDAPVCFVTAVLALAMHDSQHSKGTAWSLDRKSYTVSRLHYAQSLVSSEDDRCRAGEVQSVYVCCQEEVLHTPQTKLTGCQSFASGPGFEGAQPYTHPEQKLGGGSCSLC